MQGMRFFGYHGVLPEVRARVCTLFRCVVAGGVQLHVIMPKCVIQRILVR